MSDIHHVQLEKKKKKYTFLVVSQLRLLIGIFLDFERI